MKTTVLASIAAFFIIAGTPPAQAQTFSDVPTSSPYYTAVESLVQSGVLEGYSDGTFRPSRPVNRAEALKMILLSAGIIIDKGLYQTGFSDVPLDAWYAGHVMEGTIRGIIQGNPDGTFAGDRTVNKAEFIKMATQTFQVDLSAYKNITMAVAADVSANDWFSPYLGYAKSVGLTYPTLQDRLEPGKFLSRGECAQIIHKMGIIKFGSPAQESLASAEARLVDALVHIYNNDVAGSIARTDEALFYSNKALEQEPDSSTVKATHLLAQAFQQLFFAYNAGLEESYAQVVLFVEEAKNLADQAVATNVSAQFFATQIHEHGDTLLSQLSYY